MDYFRILSFKVRIFGLTYVKVLDFFFNFTNGRFHLQNFPLVVLTSSVILGKLYLFGNTFIYVIHGCLHFFTYSLACHSILSHGFAF